MKCVEIGKNSFLPSGVLIRFLCNFGFWDWILWFEWFLLGCVDTLLMLLLLKVYRPLGMAIGSRTK